jgi:hypothetical protein
MIHRTDIARCIAVAFALALAGCGHGEDAALTESAVQVAGLSHRASRAERLAAKKPKKPKKHGSAPVEPPPPVVASLVLTDAPATGMPAQAHADFSLSDARELFVYSVWSNLEGEHTQLVKLYSPDGELYYQKLVAFSTLIDSPRAFTTWQDVPHEQTVQPVAPHEDGLHRPRWQRDRRSRHDRAVASRGVPRRRAGSDRILWLQPYELTKRSCGAIACPTSRTWPRRRRSRRPAC